MIISNIKGEYFYSFTPTYIGMACKLLPPQVMMTDKWVNKVDLDILECAKKMMIEGRQMRQKATSEYENSILRSPYRFIALMLNSLWPVEWEIV